MLHSHCYGRQVHKKCVAAGAALASGVQMMSDAAVRKPKIMIVGNSNVGKSSLFNHLAKEYSIVANYPYTTIEIARGTLTIGGKQFELIDTPGIYSLEIQSEDEIVTRDILLNEHSACIVQCIDAANLKTSLLLTSQLLELAAPLIICLNNIDGAGKKGIEIDSTELSRSLGVPVIETVASEGKGLSGLRKAILDAKPPSNGFKHKEFIQAHLEKVARNFPEHNQPPPALVLLLLLGDASIEAWVRKYYGEAICRNAAKAARSIRTGVTTPISRMVFNLRNEWADGIVRRVSGTTPLTASRFLELFGTLARHPVYGWLILGGIIYLTYLLVGKLGTIVLVTYISEYLFNPLTSFVGNLVPFAFWQDFLVGDYGILTLGFANAVGAVLPILALFYFVLNTLEDIGYLPNLCILSNRFFQQIGLSGKSVLPIILGFGCKTAATLTTRILDSRKERYIAIFLIAFAIPCSAQLGINIAVLAFFPIAAFIFVFGVLALVEIIAGVILNRLIKEESCTDFILEIPVIRVPSLKNLLLKTYYRLKWFAVETVPLFVLGAVLLFVMEKLLVLDLLKTLLSPIVVSFLGLPIKCVEVFLLCIARREAGAVILLQLLKSGQIDSIQACVGTITISLFMPCFANIMAMIKEIGWKTALFMVLVITSASILIGGLINHLMRLFLQ
jgi:ferrous iron transport protein B